MYIYLQQVCMDTGCVLKDQLEVMDNRDQCGVRVRKIHASSAT